MRRWRIFFIRLACVMGIVDTVLIALGLAADAFAVSVCVGAGGHARDLRSMVRLSWHFGLFQCIMPLLGWWTGLWISRWFEQFDHWIAFVLLTFVGIRMLRSALYPEEVRLQKNPTRGSMLVVLSVATSVDAYAVGFSLALVRISIWYPSLVIGIVTGLTSYLGIRLGERFSRFLGRTAEAAGGLVLLLVGLKILFPHF